LSDILARGNDTSRWRATAYSLPSSRTPTTAATTK